MIYFFSQNTNLKSWNLILPEKITRNFQIFPPWGCVMARSHLTRESLENFVCAIKIQPHMHARNAEPPGNMKPCLFNPFFSKIFDFCLGFNGVRKIWITKAWKIFFLRNSLFTGNYFNQWKNCLIAPIFHVIFSIFQLQFWVAWPQSLINYTVSRQKIQIIVYIFKLQNWDTQGS